LLIENLENFKSNQALQNQDKWETSLRRVQGANIITRDEETKNPVSNNSKVNTFLQILTLLDFAEYEVC